MNRKNIENPPRDEDIDYSDIPELDDTFFARAEVKEPPEKKLVSLRIDKDVLEFFRSQGRGYQTRINALLRQYMKHKQGRTGTDG